MPQEVVLESAIDQELVDISDRVGNVGEGREFCLAVSVLEQVEVKERRVEEESLGFVFVERGAARFQEPCPRSST